MFGLREVPNKLTGKHVGPKTDLFLVRDVMTEDAVEFVAEFSPLLTKKEAEVIVEMLNDSLETRRSRCVTLR